VKPLLALAVVALAAAAPAQAKEIASVKLCGASGCATVPGSEFAGPHDESSPLWSGQTIAWPAVPAPYYRVVVVVGSPGDRVLGRADLWYVPAQAKITMAREARQQALAWVRVGGAWKAGLDRLARDVDPYAIPRVTRVTVGGRPVDDPQSYLALWTLRGKPTGYPLAAGRPIVFTSTSRSPWTDGNALLVWPRARLLQRDTQVVGLPRAIADRIAARASLDDGGRAFPWLPLGVALGLAGVVVASMLAAWRLPPRRARARAA
jgi:hypothetical protein